MRPIEFYVAILAAALFVFESNKGKPFLSRFLITVSSAGLGFSLADDTSAYIGAPLSLVGLLITTLGFLALELIVALISDRQFVKDAILKRLDR